MIIDREYINKIIDEGAESVADVMVFMENCRGRGPQLFRGESEEYKRPLSPRIARKKLPDGSLEPFQNCKHFTIYEYSQINKCQEDHKNGKLKDIYLKAFLPSIHHDNVNWLPLAQHYNYDTRLLDVTMDILVALYFACLNKEEEDGFVYMISIDSFIVHKPKTLPDSWRSLFENPIENNWGHFFIPKIPNVRLLAQRGGFVWWTPIGEQMHNSKIPIRIKSSAKKKIIETLNVLGTRHNTLFPEETLFP